MFGLSIGWYRYDASKPWKEQLIAHKVQHCVIAAGFERDDVNNMSIDISVVAADDSIISLTSRDLDAYDQWSGEIYCNHSSSSSNGNR